MEGVAFSLKDTFTIFEEMKIPVTSIRLGGGGARSCGGKFRPTSTAGSRNRRGRGRRCLRRCILAGAGAEGLAVRRTSLRRTRPPRSEEDCADAEGFIHDAILLSDI